MNEHFRIILSLSACLAIYIAIKGYRKIIFWLADASGVSNQIRRSTIKEIGGRMYQDHFWFNGGVPGAWLVSNALKRYAEAFKNDETPQVDRIRTEIYKQGDKHIEL